MPVPQENRVFYEQARCLFHKKIESFMNRQDACSTRKWSLCEQARCLFHKKIEPFMNRQDACSTGNWSLCEQARCLFHKKRMMQYLS